MNRFLTIIASAVLVALGAACTPPPGGTGGGEKRVMEQRLAAYTPIRRLTYRDACGSDGPLTICVERISIADSAALVEARISNASPQPYLQESPPGARALLADDAGMNLEWSNGVAMEYHGRKETIVHFRMEGHCAGNPARFMVNNIRMKGAAETNPGISLMVRLGD